MATASKIQLSLDACGEFHVRGISRESATKASEVLQENHELHHIFRNAAGFHSMYDSLRRLLQILLLESFLNLPSPLHSFDEYHATRSGRASTFRFGVELKFSCDGHS